MSTEADEVKPERKEGRYGERNDEECKEIEKMEGKKA
jgi:hypothetical protein